MRSYLLLGGAGFLGANLAWNLASAGANVIVFERPGADLSRLEGIRDKVEVVTGDISDAKGLIALMSSRKADSLVHFVSGLLPSSDFSRYGIELKTVICPTISLCGQCSEAGIRVIFFSSGGAIYGNSHGEALSEEHKLEPISFYGLSKVQIEEYIRFEHRRSRLEYLIIRPSNPYGRFQRLEGNQGLVSIILGRLLRKEPITVWGDGSIVRDYIDVEDLMGAISRLLESGAKDTVFNVGSGMGASVLEVIRMVELASAQKADILFAPGRPTDVKSVILDIARLKGAIDFNPIDLKTGIQNYCKRMG